MTLWRTVESVLTEEEAAEYLEQLAFEEEKEEILLSCFFLFCFFFFFPGSKIPEIGMFSCYEIQSFHNQNRENKRYDRICLLGVYFKTNRSHQRIKSYLFIDHKYFCLPFFCNFLENQNCLHFFLKSTDLVRNIDPITSYFVSNLDLATTIQRPTSVRWQVIEIGGKRNLITHFSDLRD